MKEAFAKFGATKKNIFSSCGAIASNGDVVLSLWEHHFEKAVAGKITHKDNLERWVGVGANEFRQLLDLAKSEQRTIRCVVAHTDDPDGVDIKGTNRDVSKWFSAKTDWVGELTKWDGNDYEVVFQRES